MRVADYATAMLHISTAPLFGVAYYSGIFLLPFPLAMLSLKVNGGNVMQRGEGRSPLICAECACGCNANGRTNECNVGKWRQDVNTDALLTVDFGEGGGRFIMTVMLMHSDFSHISVSFEHLNVFCCGICY